MTKDAKRLVSANPNLEGRLSWKEDSALEHKQVVRAIRIYASHVAKRFTVDGRGSEIDLAYITHTVHNQYALDMQNGTLQAIQKRPDYAFAVLAMKEKAAELAPGLARNYFGHISRQNSFARLHGTTEFKIVLTVLAGGLGFYFAPRNLPDGAIAAIGVASGAGWFAMSKYVDWLIDRKAIAEEKLFQKAIRDAFYHELKNPRT